MNDLLDAAKKRLRTFAEETDLKRKTADLGARAADKTLRAAAGLVSDKTIPYLNRYDNAGFMEGSGYFLREPAKDARWSVGFAKASIIPERVSGDLYLGGYLAFPPNKVEGKLTDQYVRALAFDDGSDRGINVFAVIDCVGLSNTDVRAVRLRLQETVAEKNVVSVNISATHCHSGVDTMGVWGDLLASLRKNPRAVKSRKTVDQAVSGRNADFMAYLIETAAETIEQAISEMRPGRLELAQLDAADYVRDKRPPDVTDPYITVLRFSPDDPAAQKTITVLMGAHPTCYGAKHRQISADFPYFVCRTLEEQGYNAAFFQGAEAAVATDRGRHISGPATLHGGIARYGEAIAKYVLSADDAAFTPLKPVLNVLLKETLLPADNPLLALLGKLRVINNNITKVTNGEDGKDYDLYFPTEIGLAQFGGEMTFALIPGELMPEIAYGGALEPHESYTGEAWDFPPLCEAVGGRMCVVGLCNDCIAYIVPDNDYGSYFAPLHYEEIVSPGRRTASNIAGAFRRLAEAAEKSIYTPVNPGEENT